MSPGVNKDSKIKTMTNGGKKLISWINGYLLILKICVEYSSYCQVWENIFHQLIAARGPDGANSLKVKFHDELVGLFEGSLLWMQGSHPQIQPIADDLGNVLLWNGDNFNFERDLSVSDSFNLLQELQSARTIQDVIHCIETVEGPWSLIYYLVKLQLLFFGRDVFGRRSLLWSFPDELSDHIFCLSSVSLRCEKNFKEVPAIGLYSLDMKSLMESRKICISLYPFHHTNPQFVLLEEYSKIIVMTSTVKSHISNELNKDVPSENCLLELKKFPSNFIGENFQAFRNYLQREMNLFSRVFEASIRKRTRACTSRCKDCTHSKELCTHSKYAVMFSGGLDSALITWYLATILPQSEPIDLLNVSFETKNSSSNTKHPSKGTKGSRTQKDHGVSTNQEEFCSFDSPDRTSALECLQDVLKCCQPRKWNFVEINVSAQELERERQEVISDLIAPQYSVLDDSIGCALYFCARGSGLVGGTQYVSPARVLFSGLGADEQACGYSRHRGVFDQSGWTGLMAEIELELQRIHSRNCGRDDRVISHHGRVVRFPFLDEEVVTCLNSLPVWKKANLTLPRGVGEKLLLRAIAHSLGLISASVLPKRAIQFGSRIAKMENRKEKGGDSCLRL